MPEPRFEGVTTLPQTAAIKERFALQKIEAAQSLSELIELLEDIKTIKDPEKLYTREEILVTLGKLDSALSDLKATSQLPVCSLTEFPLAHGLRRTIGRLFQAKGYVVNDAVFEDPEPPLAS